MGPIGEHGLILTKRSSAKRVEHSSSSVYLYARVPGLDAVVTKTSDGVVRRTHIRHPPNQQVTKLRSTRIGTGIARSRRDKGDTLGWSALVAIVVQLSFLERRCEKIRHSRVDFDNSYLGELDVATVNRVALSSAL